MIDKWYQSGGQSCYSAKFTPASTVHSIYGRTYQKLNFLDIDWPVHVVSVGHHCIIMPVDVESLDFTELVKKAKINCIEYLAPQISMELHAEYKLLTGRVCRKFDQSEESINNPNQDPCIS